MLAPAIAILFATGGCAAAFTIATQWAKVPAIWRQLNGLD